MNRVYFGGLGIMAFLLVTMIQGPVSTEACDCLPPPEPAKALAQSAAVFLGKVVAIEDGPPGTLTKAVTLDVEKWWKGGEAARLQVLTANNGATCGYGFQQGTRYLVYASGNRDKGGLLRVSLCSRTRPAQTAEGTGDFKDLGEGKTPSKKSS